MGKSHQENPPKKGSHKEKNQPNQDPQPPSNSGGKEPHQSNYEKVSREWPRSTTDQSPQESQDTQTQDGPKANMMERWKDGKMKDQPYHAIEAVGAMDEDTGGAGVQRGSSVEYYDPNVETER